MGPERHLQPVVPLPPESDNSDEVGAKAVEAARLITVAPEGWVKNETYEPTRGVIHLKEGDFKVDPRRVVGHPSNLTNGITSVYSRERRKQFEDDE